jgi:hypothetical protein
MDATWLKIIRNYMHLLEVSGYAIRLSDWPTRGIVGGMETNSSAVRATVDARPPRQRARRTNDPFASLEMNTARGRRVGDLVRAYLNALGRPTDVERQAAVIQAAELQVLAEEARSAALKSGTADLDQVVRVQGAADRAVRRLGLKPTAAPPTMTLRERLIAEAEAMADAEPADADLDEATHNEPEAAA